MGQSLKFPIQFHLPPIGSLVSRFDHQLIANDGQNAIHGDVERVVAIGDIHGDADALKTILRELNLIDHLGDWKGGKTFLVQTGDILGRGSQSREVMDVLMKLQVQAEYAGGKVIVLLGNHEYYLLRSEFRMISVEDGAKFLDLIGTVEKTEFKIVEALAFAMGENSPYGRWLASLPATVKIGRRLFVHAGVEKWFERVDVNRLNATVRAWMKYFQNPDSNPRPTIKTAWVYGFDGPLMTRKLSQGMLPAADFSNWLAKMEVDQVVVGHTKVKDLTTMTANRYYGNQLVMIDTGISGAVGGTPSAVEFLTGQGPRVHIISRGISCHRVHL